MIYCMVSENGKLLEILQQDREPQASEFKVPITGYHDVFNIELFSDAEWDFKLNKWVGVGAKRQKDGGIHLEDEIKKLTDRLISTETKLELAEEKIIELSSMLGIS